MSGTKNQEHTGWVQSTEEFIIATHTQESGQLMVEAKLGLDNGQWNSWVARFESLVAAHQFQAYDTFKPTFKLCLVISSKELWKYMNTPSFSY